MKVTYFGTTTLLFDDGITQVMFDAHFTRPSLVKVFFSKISSNHVMIDEYFKEVDLSRLKGIFVSHSHYDHVLDAPYIARKYDARIYGSRSTLNVALGEDVKENNMQLIKEKETYTIGKFKVTILPSIHSKVKWYNNDLGQTIDQPLIQPARKNAFKEGGSYDFLVECENKKYLIRPSYNYLEEELDDMKADVLFLGVAGVAGDSKKEVDMFFKQTVEKVQPSLVIPIHLDNFFSPLERPVKENYVPYDNQRKTLHIVSQYCKKHQISFVVLLPETFIQL